MKYFHLLILIIAVYTAKAQSVEMHLKGKLIGNKNIKYAFLYDLNKDGFQLSKKAAINNKGFSINSSYDLAKASSIWQVGYLVISDEESPSQEYIEKNNRRVFYEKDVRIQYSVEESIYSVKSGFNNLIEDKFYRNNASFLRKRDSIANIIDKEPISQELKFAKKQKEQRIFLTQMFEANLAVIKEEPNSLSSMLNMVPLFAVNQISYQEAESIYQSFSDSSKNTINGEKIASLVQKLKNNADFDPRATKLKIGDIMYGFTLDDISGVKVKSTDVYGTYTLLDFWASWCIPCRNETPYLKKAFEQFKDRGFRVIAISIDAEDALEKWRAAVEVDGTRGFVNLTDPSGRTGIAKELNINAIPANYVIDQNGQIVGKNLRGSDLIELLSKLYKLN
jgi:peroxiredoxin/beta-lactamase class D